MLSDLALLALAGLTAVGPLQGGSTPPAKPAKKVASAQSGVPIPGLQGPAKVSRDAAGVPHLEAASAHDVLLLQGYVHAQDRFFQMDLARRTAAGTLAELLGDARLEQDVAMRAVGLQRAAERSWAALSKETRDGIQAYAKGVNAWLAANPLPSEYAALELTQVPAWSALDTVAVAKLLVFEEAFQLDLEDTLRLAAYQQAGALAGFDGALLFHEDVCRSAPFDPASTVPDASGAPLGWGAPGAAQPVPLQGQGGQAAGSAQLPSPAALALAADLLERLRELPAFRGVLDPRLRAGSNGFAVAGSLAVGKRPIAANDPHVPLGTPASFHPVHLRVTGAAPLNVAGDSLPGMPYVVLGHNASLSWGATNALFDVADTFEEKVVADPKSPSGFSSVHGGKLEPLVRTPETFRVNVVGNGVPDDLQQVPPGGSVPQYTYLVPRRDGGPLLAFDPANEVALSVQFVGFAATRELDTYRRLMRAPALPAFQEALLFHDAAPQGWIYSDVHGRIAYLTSGELPLRQDLQAGSVDGLMPAFLRRGTGGNDWLAHQGNRPGHQALAFRVLPQAELPKAIDPASGWLVNANNDPLGLTLDNDPLNTLRPGGGILYLGRRFDPGFRAGRIGRLLQQRLAQGLPLSVQDLQEIQADTALADAEFFVPHIREAWLRGIKPTAHPQLKALASSSRIAEAVERLHAWDRTAPTGIPEGYDAADVDGVLHPPTQAEIARSVAATLYSTWRAQILAATVDAALQAHGLPVPDGDSALAALKVLLQSYEARHGVGLSGVAFFKAPGLGQPKEVRDWVILKALADGLDLLASPAFAPAFGQSTQQASYRWGLLHRLELAHALGAPYSLPGAAFPAPLPQMPGIPLDGGYQTVDRGSHDPRARTLQGFTFEHGAGRRYAVESLPERPRARSSLPGGVRGVLGDPHYASLLPAWLTNDSYALLFTAQEVEAGSVATTVYVPGT